MDRTGPKTYRLFQWTPVELVFFFFFFFVKGYIQELQYVNSPDLERMSWTSELYSFIADLFVVIPYALFYKLLIPVLMARRYLKFAVVLVAGIFMFDWYLRLQDWIIATAPFIPDSVRFYGKRSMHHTPAIFGRQSVMLTLTNLLCVTALAYILRSARQEKTVSQLKEVQLSLQLESLRAQVHPHFFFNTLNNIYSLALQQSGQTAVMISRLADLMRYMLTDAAQPLVPLANETAFLRNYVTLERIRHPRPELITYEVQTLDQEVMVPPLLFLPLIENSFKHGLQQDENGFNHIVIIYADDELTLSVKNNKPTLPADVYKGGHGIANVRERLQLLYPGRHELKIRESPGLFELYVNIQLKVV